MNTTDKIMALANTYAASYGKALLEKLYGTSQSYTEQCEAEAFKNREALLAEIEALVRDAERVDYLQTIARCDPKMDGKHVWWPTTFSQAQKLKGATLREAIDAAMQEKQS